MLLPQARVKVAELEALVARHGLDVMLFDGWRDPAQQVQHMQSGASKVTDPLDSHHVWGVAFDIVFRNAAGLPYWPPDDDPRWRQLAQLGRSIGLRSGGLEWGWDYPHFWLPGYQVAALKNTYGEPSAFLRRQGVLV